MARARSRRRFGWRRARRRRRRWGRSSARSRPRSDAADMSWLLVRARDRAVGFALDDVLEVVRTVGLVAALAGLRFDDANRDVLAAGLTRAGREFPGGAAALVAAAADGDERARALVYSAATVGETYFFRHPEHFELIRRIAP